eukprot:scaffold8459_cov121-Isochrysis_galbana.AAC.1
MAGPVMLIITLRRPNCLNGCGRGMTAIVSGGGAHRTSLQESLRKALLHCEVRRAFRLFEASCARGHPTLHLVLHVGDGHKGVVPGVPDGQHTSSALARATLWTQRPHRGIEAGGTARKRQNTCEHRHGIPDATRRSLKHRHEHWDDETLGQAKGRAVAARWQVLLK